MLSWCIFHQNLDAGEGGGNISKIEVSEKAIKKLTEFFKVNGKHPIRLEEIRTGCG